MMARPPFFVIDFLFARHYSPTLTRIINLPIIIH